MEAYSYSNMNRKESHGVLGQEGTGGTGDEYTEAPTVFVTAYFLK